MPVEKNMLSTVANYELATRYLHAWAMNALDQAGTYGLNSVVLENWMANKYRFENNIASEDPIFVWMNGHGNENNLAGQDGEIILDMSNIDLLSGRVCYAFSCLTASQLGPASVQAGAQSYIGFSEEFIFLYDTNSPSPLLDNYAKWCMMPGTQISLSLMQGKTTGEAFADSQFVFQYGIDYWSDSVDETAPQMLACLYQDKDYQSLSGDQYAYITPDQQFSEPQLPVEGPVQTGMNPLITLSLIGSGLYYLMKGV